MTVDSIRAKRQELVAACDAASAESARACDEVARLERQIQVAREAVERADASVFKLMEQVEGLDRLLKGFEDLAALGLDLGAGGAPALPAAAPAAPEPPPAVPITTKPVSELVRKHLYARPGRNFTPAEMAEAVFNEYPGSWRSPQEIIKAVSCALPRAGRRVPTSRGVAFQAVGRSESAA